MTTFNHGTSASAAERASQVTVFRRVLRRLRPVRRRHLLLHRGLDGVEGSFVEGLHVGWVKRMDGPLFPLMCEIGREEGVDEEWCRAQIEEGAHCLLALDRHSQPVGVGLMTCRPFWVEEIRHELNPGAEGCYLYATYVTPVWRGKRIQRLLDTERMLLARADGARHVFAVVEAGNVASIRGHEASGFGVLAEISIRQWRRRSLARVRRRGEWPRGVELTSSGTRLGPFELMCNDGRVGHNSAE